MRRTLDIEAGMRRGRSMPGPQPTAAQGTKTASLELESRWNLLWEATRPVPGSPNPALSSVNYEPGSVAAAAKSAKDRPRTTRS